MRYGRYRFLCRLENKARLPFYKGSTFRGAFGLALKKVVCVLKKEECSQCLLKQKCVYALVFETSKAIEAPKGSRIVLPPHPFVIEPPLTTETKFPKGVSFDFNLLLFGELNNSLLYFIYAFDQMGKIGIGKKIDGKRGQFVLKEVKHKEQIVYSDADQKLNATDSIERLSIPAATDYSENGFRLRLILETLLRLKFENRLKADLPFHVFVRAMLRRASSLLNCYGKGEPPLDYRRLVNRAEAIQISDTNLNWFDWKRYSHRQDKSMLMGGLIGSVTYEGNIGEYIPLIEFCSKTHLGKQTSFGLVKIKAEMAP